jgi:superfamily II DNA or RNA helicase
MNAPDTNFQPGSLIRARGREWVVQSDSKRDWLRLRPLGGADDDAIALIPELEIEPVEPATFPPPDPARPGNHAAALLLRDALRFTLSAGAGPFRSFGNIAVEPRAYQLVPLLMALRLSSVRLLIADDVGIGKTIEAGLIVRELMDRGEISCLAVLCPPHLVEQWQSELETHFNLPSVALTAASSARVERDLPLGVSLFDHYRIAVVSLDYIKSERHREYFLSVAPECIVVDEAHASTSTGAGKQLRFNLLQRLAANEARHLILLTATPHSGDEGAFYNLLSLLDARFRQLQFQTSADNPLRRELARHFVQRRRRDIVEWQARAGDMQNFPVRMKADVTYNLSGDWGKFFDSVQDYCRNLAERFDANGKGHKLIWYVTLGLLRCSASSPAAAVKALTTRLEGREVDELESDDSPEIDGIHDGEADDLSGNDLEPPARLEDAARLQNLIDEAKRLSGAADNPKLIALTRHVEALLQDKFQPVVFCRFVATAHYVAEHLKKAFPHVAVEAVTGEYSPEERRERVASLEEADTRILVATDCLSEGINLQHLFTAVIHYDLAWNPTRHEQREGRIDRFGQRASEVRCIMLYGQDNPVDGFVLTVILRKSEAIQKELGVLVPMPEDKERINLALVKAALMKRQRERASPQLALFDDAESGTLAPLEAEWRDAIEKARTRRTVFAQRTIRPEQVLPEWQKQQAALGTHADVERFLTSACARLNAPLEPAGGRKVRFLFEHLPETLRQRLADENIRETLLVDFDELHRSHPIVSVLAEYVLEDSLANDRPLAARAAVTLTGDVETVTTLYLLRLRHRLGYMRRGEPFQMMAEEAVALAVAGRVAPRWIAEEEVARLLECRPAGNLPTAAVTRELDAALAYLEANQDELTALARERARMLLVDHERVREAARDVGKFSVAPCLPVDVIGVYVLLPDGL